jgi:hypothetical protein
VTAADGSDSTGSGAICAVGAAALVGAAGVAGASGPVAATDGGGAAGVVVGAAGAADCWTGAAVVLSAAVLGTALVGVVAGWF